MSTFVFVLNYLLNVFCLAFFFTHNICLDFSHWSLSSHDAFVFSEGKPGSLLTHLSLTAYCEPPCSTGPGGDMLSRSLNEYSNGVFVLCSL